MVWWWLLDGMNDRINGLDGWAVGGGCISSQWMDGSAVDDVCMSVAPFSEQAARFFGLRSPPSPSPHFFLAFLADQAAVVWYMHVIYRWRLNIIVILADLMCQA